MQPDYNSNYLKHY